MRNVALYRDRWVGTRYSNESAAQQLNTWRGDGPERVAAELVDENPNGRVGAVVWSGGLIAVARGVAGFDLIAPACE